MATGIRAADARARAVSQDLSLLLRCEFRSFHLRNMFRNKGLKKKRIGR